jgi:CYTH domain-containing protein
MNQGGELFGDKARVEIERKFLLEGDAWRAGAEAVRVRQGFLAATERCTVRVRTVLGRGVMTIKGPTRGFSRHEFEYEIPVEDAEFLLEGFCVGPVIDKVRHRVSHAGLVWEIDVFEGENAGLVLAEVELDSEDQPVELPPWIGEEVTGDERYYNAYLSRHPHSTWGDAPPPE